MKAVGIVCEYNPFHLGHKRQIDILRENGAETVICAMSGNYTQRGELAIADKYTRAKAAVECGADVVIELPFPFSSLSAEGFARAGAYLLASVGADTISFGSECADRELLKSAASAVASEDFIAAYSSAQKDTGAAKAYFDTLHAIMGNDIELLSNDILAVSYIAAINELKPDMDIFPIERKGGAYRSGDIGDRIPSASAIRRAVTEESNCFNMLDESHMPLPSLNVFKDAQIKGDAPVHIEKASREILSFFKLLIPTEITARAVLRSCGGQTVADDGCGIVERICNAARSSDSLSEMLTKSYNARYTDARINRVLLFSLFGASDIWTKALPQYTTILAASERGRRYLSDIRKSVDYTIITKPADAPDGALTTILKASDAFYAETMGKKSDNFIKMHPFMA